MDDSGDNIHEEELQMLEHDELDSDFFPDSPYETSSDSEVEIWSNQPRQDGSRGPLSGEATQSIIASADRERLLAKAALVALTFRASSTNEQKKHDRWVDRFETFRTSVLQVTDPSSVPTVDEIVQFIYIVPRHMKGRGSGSHYPPTKATLEYGVQRIIMHCKFKFEAFVLTGGSSLKINSMIQLLLDEGALVLESDRDEPLCITSHDILRMNTATLEDSLSAGTLNWDTTIHGVLYLSIQSALSARCGDILADWDDEKCLRYEDIRIVLKIVEGREALWATFKLKHCKGTKGVPETQKTIELGQVHDNKFNACCPISLLIIWSLRIGAVKETSWEELLSNMRKRPAHVLVWSRPDMPVFCSITPESTLKLEKPATTTLSKSILRTAAQTAGLLAIPHTHDIRRGSGRELVHLPSLGDDNYDAARKGLGHTRKSLHDGVTDLYIGASGVDTWNMRLALKHPLPGDSHTLVYCDESFKRERVSADEVDELCEEFGLDPAEKGTRGLAILRHKDRLHRDWVNTKKREREEGPNDPTSQRLMDGARPQEEISGVVLGRPYSEQTGSSLSVVDDPSIESGPSSPNNYAVLSANRDTFIDFFSHINEIASSVIGTFRRVTGQQGSYTGKSSRDVSSRKKHPCPNSKFGCPSEYIDIPTRDRHHASCTYSSVEMSEQAKADAKADEAERKHLCKNCPAKFTTESSLRSHTNQFHFVAKRYVTKGCKNETVFQTYNELSIHIKTQHSGWVARGCPVPYCRKGNEQFAKPALLRQHLKRAHGWSVAQSKEEVPDLRRRFQHQSCSFEGCEDTTVFKLVWKYKQHVEEAHGLDEEAFRALVKRDEEHLDVDDVQDTE